MLRLIFFLFAGATWLTGLTTDIFTREDGQ